MRKSGFKIIFIPLCLFLILSCKKEIVYEGIPGELKGKVSISFEENDGVEVYIDGLSSEFRTTTNSKGEYSIKGLKTGIYDIIFRKEGYCPFKNISFQFYGGDLPDYVPTINLYPVPNIRVTSLKVDTGRYYQYAEPYVTLQMSFSEPQPSNMRIYVGNSERVSCSDYIESEATYNGNYSSSLFSFNLPSSLLLKLPKEKQLYMVVYPSTTSSTIGYIDIMTGNLVYPVDVENHSSVISFMIPKKKVYQP